MLEMLCITQSEVSNGRAFVESKFNDLRYEIYPRLYLRNILFNNPHIEAIAAEYLDDNERWQMWIDAIASNVGGLAAPDFSYLNLDLNPSKILLKSSNFYNLVPLKAIAISAGVQSLFFLWS
jgi:hypothetical protein